MPLVKAFGTREVLGLDEHGIVLSAGRDFSGAPARRGGRAIAVRRR